MQVTCGGRRRIMPRSNLASLWPCRSHRRSCATAPTHRTSPSIPVPLVVEDASFGIERRYRHILVGGVRPRIVGPVWCASDWSASALASSIRSAPSCWRNCCAARGGVCLRARAVDPDAGAGQLPGVRPSPKRTSGLLRRETHLCGTQWRGCLWSSPASGVVTLDPCQRSGVALEAILDDDSVAIDDGKPERDGC